MLVWSAITVIVRADLGLTVWLPETVPGDAAPLCNCLGYMFLYCRRTFHTGDYKKMKKESLEMPDKMAGK